MTEVPALAAGTSRSVRGADRSAGAAGTADRDAFTDALDSARAKAQERRIEAAANRRDGRGPDDDALSLAQLVARYIVPPAVPAAETGPAGTGAGSGPDTADALGAIGRPLSSPGPAWPAVTSTGAAAMSASPTVASAAAFSVVDLPGSAGAGAIVTSSRAVLPDDAAAVYPAEATSAGATARAAATPVGAQVAATGIAPTVAGVATAPDAGPAAADQDAGTEDVATPVAPSSGTAPGGLGAGGAGAGQAGAGQAGVEQPAPGESADEPVMSAPWASLSDLGLPPPEAASPDADPVTSTPWASLSDLGLPAPDADADGAPPVAEDPVSVPMPVAAPAPVSTWATPAVALPPPESAPTVAAVGNGAAGTPAGGTLAGSPDSEDLVPGAPITGPSATEDALAPGSPDPVVAPRGPAAQDPPDPVAPAPVADVPKPAAPVVAAVTLPVLPPQTVPTSVLTPGAATPGIASPAPEAGDDDADRSASGAHRTPASVTARGGDVPTAASTESRTAPAPAQPAPAAQSTTPPLAPAPRAEPEPSATAALRPDAAPAAGRAAASTAAAAETPPPATTPAAAVSGAERYVAPSVAPTPVVIPAMPTPPPVIGTPGTPPFQQVAAAVGPLLRGPDGSYQLQLNLTPAALGQVRIQVELRGGEVSIVMHTIETGARDLLRDNLDSLRQQLQQLGVKSGHVDVDVNRDEAGRQWAQGFGGDTAGRDGRGGRPGRPGYAGLTVPGAPEPPSARPVVDDGTVDVRV